MFSVEGGDPHEQFRWRRDSHLPEDLAAAQAAAISARQDQGEISWDSRSESAATLGLVPNREAQCDTNSFDESLLQIPDQVQLIDKLLHPKQLEDFCTKLTRF